jgi:acyl-CoA synthetase (AMP-forming)/AMP-acid ligase II
MYLTQALHRAAAATPDVAATQQGGRLRTYRELLDRVARLAGGLRSLGVVAGDRVAVLSPNTDRYIETLFAVPWAGGVVNPVNTRWNAAEIAYSIADSGTRVLIVDEAFSDVLPQLLSSAGSSLEAVVFAGAAEPPALTVPYDQLATAAEPVDDAYRCGEDLLGIFYTGGTTGSPKGVMLTHANVMTAALGGLASGHMLGHGRAVRALHVAPLFHLADFSLFNMTSIVGGTNVVVAGFSCETVLDAIAQQKITDVLLVPTMLQMLVDFPGLQKFDLSSLRGIIYGAAPISPDLLSRALAAFPQAELTQGYGMTETAAGTSILGFDDHFHPVRRHSAGRATPVSEIVITDDNGAVLPTGTVGEIRVRGGQVMSGYWDNPLATAAAVRDGWMHTGDAGRLDDDGYVYIVDRIKDMIISGGENVYSSEVENALSQHPAVAACAVIGIPDERWGEAVHAVVVRATDATVTAEELRAHTKSLIAGYKVPRSVAFIDALPLSGAGKVLKRSLREAAASGAASPTPEPVTVTQPSDSR